MQNVDREKITEVILYFTSKIPECTGDRCMRLMYLADKTHLERYARIISSDVYLATPDGARPMYAPEIMDKVLKPIAEYYTTASRLPDTNQLSESDITVMDLVIKLYGEYPMWHLREMAQDKAWHKAFNTKDSLHWTGRKILVGIEDIATTFDDGELLIEHLHS